MDQTHLTKQNIIQQTLLSMKNTYNPNQSSQNLYQHLCQLLTRLPQSKSINNYQQFQRLSVLVKNTKFKNKQPLFDSEIQINSRRRISYPQWISTQQKLLSVNSLTNLHQNKRINANNQDRLIQNFAKTQNILKEIGISFGQQQGYKINCMLKKVAQKFHATKLRYWGKILTSKGDYTILQGVSKKQNPPIVQGDVEKYREGVNYYSYWVSHLSIGQQFLELPIITPQQMIASRKIKHIFTGNLQAPIMNYPRFLGCQKHLLKAQIVRITHNCEIAPKGLYANLEENPDQIEFAEEFKLPDFGQLNNLQNWVHVNPYILNMGRATYFVDPKIPQEQKQELMTKLTQTDPKIQRLKGINQDKPVQKMGFEGCWIARIHGNTQLFNNVGKDQGTTSCYGVISLKNPNWPGWTTVCNYKGFGSIYIGYGVKSTQAPFSPISPQDLLIEGQDNDEFHEPNPKDPPDELQPDSDDQNKKAQQ